jgi:hypothetical protein
LVTERLKESIDFTKGISEDPDATGGVLVVSAVSHGTALRYSGIFALLDAGQWCWHGRMDASTLGIQGESMTLLLTDRWANAYLHSRRSTASLRS